MSTRTLLLVDFSAVYAIAWHSVGDHEEAGAAHSRTVRMCRDIVSRLEADSVVLCGDTPRNWRHDVYPGYKASRAAKPAGYSDQMRAAWHELAQEVPATRVQGYEADDVIATLAHAWAAEGEDRRVRIITHDKDLEQLVDGQTTIISLRDLLRGELVELDTPAVLARRGVTPAQLGDLLALTGDTSDNVPGVPGVGEKRAAHLLGEHHDLDTVLAVATSEQRPAGVMWQRIAEGAEQARVSRLLVELCAVVPVALPWRAARVETTETKPARPAEEKEQESMTTTYTFDREGKIPARQAASGRFGAARVATGIPRAANKTIVTGRPGIGKTRFLSTIEKVFLLDLEDGLRGASPDHDFGAFRDAADRPLIPRTLDELLDALDAFAGTNSDRRYHHLGVDGLTGIERLVHESVCSRERVEHMDAKGYKELWRAAEPVMARVQRRLDEIRSTGVHIWIAAHASEVYDSVSTTGETFRKWDLLLKGAGETGVHARNFWRQWANNVWFLDWSTSLQRKAKGARQIARQDARVLHTSETGTHYAKSRDRLPPTLPADWEDVSRAMASAASNDDARTIAQLREQIAQVTERIADEDVRARVLRAAAEATTVSRLSAYLARAQGHATLDAPAEEQQDTAEVAS
jgi:5'-3' exonuclease